MGASAVTADKAFPYQRDGIDWLAGKLTAYLADEPGLGKTMQAVRAADMIGASVVQVCCPAAVGEGWRRAFQRWSDSQCWIDGRREILPIDQDDPDFPHRVSVSSYERIERGLAFWQTGAPPDILIIDEAHYLKNASAKRTQALFGPKCDGVGGLVERAGRVWLLSGTPSPKNPGDLWTSLRACAPWLIHGKTGKPLSYWPFVDRYCHTRPGRFGGMDIVKGKNLDELAQRVEPFFLRRKTDDVLPDLPGVRIDELPLDCATAARALRSLERDPDTARLAAALEAEGPRALEASPHGATVRRLTGLAKVPAMVNWARNWLQSGGHKLVLFAYHTEVIDELAAGLRAFKPTVIDGRVPGPARQGKVDRFVAEPDREVFIGQIQAAGTGLDGIQHASRDLIFVESSWIDDENKQVIGRLRRVGQRNAVLVRFAMLAGSIDERIQRACMRRADDIRRLFG